VSGSGTFFAIKSKNMEAVGVKLLAQGMSNPPKGSGDDNGGIHFLET
jgi:hypothetical protein